MDRTRAEVGAVKLVGGGHWVLEVLPQRGKAILTLVQGGLALEAARDLVSEALVACVKEEERPDDPLAFFHGVLEKRVNRYLRDEKPRLAATEPLTEQRAAEDPTPSEELCTRELWALVEKVLEPMPEPRGQVAWLRLAGRKPAEIRRELGLAPSTERRHWAVAREELLEALAEHLEP